MRMISKLDTRWCASENVDLLRGWIVRSYIGWRRKRNIFSLVSFKTVKETTIHNRSK